jgi:hypothetical protein
MRAESDPEGAGPIVRRLAVEVYERAEPLFRDVSEDK